jgi:hypothetical protein
LRILQLQENSGKGAAVRAGANVAAAPIVAFMDADMSVDPSQLPLLVAAIKNADIAIGSRSLTDSTVESSDRRRLIMGRTFSLLANTVTKVGLKDTQCGFKAFRTPVARLLFHLGVVDRFAFDVEVLWLAQRLGMQISEVPVQWRDATNSTVRPMADSMSMALDVCRIHWRKKRPPIPALVVEAESKNSGPKPERILSEAYSAFRQTDPVLPLSHDRVLVLLPLCQSDEVHGTATRLRVPSTNLKVRKRLISGNELMNMTPLPWVNTGHMLHRTVRSSDSGLSERRSTHRSPRVFRHHEQIDLEPSSRREV